MVGERTRERYRQIEEGKRKRGMTTEGYKKERERIKKTEKERGKEKIEGVSENRIIV